MKSHSIFITFIIIFASWLWLKLCRNPPLPTLQENPWWGAQKAGEDDTTVRPFRINIPEDDIRDLKSRLSLPYGLSSPLKDSNFTYGFNSETLTVILDYWKDNYDWRAAERRLNGFPHFITQIEGLDIHFVHLKPKSVDPSKHSIVPLLMIHGWPGSFVEFDEILPLLTTPREGSDVVFEVICPSLPGYGFSQPASKQGLGALETAQIFVKLMKRLGFHEFYVQGGDWGSLITSNIATLFPQNTKGMHANVPSVMTTGTQFKQLLGSILPSGWVMRKEDEPLMYPLHEKFHYILRETGYAHLQATKPDTIGAVLSNSPVGLAAYILEKFSSWTHKENMYKSDGGLLSPDFPISLDRLLDNVSLYWFTQSITSSMRFYAESMSTMFSSRINEITTNEPAGFSAFPQEIQHIPDNLASHKFKNIIFYRRHNKGGHFAAMEVPEILANDIFEFVSIIETNSHYNKNEL